jgi:polysaccharide biosynthesis protein PslH
MRILYVTNDLPWPLTSGYLRHYHFIRALSERHDIDLLSLVRSGHSPDDVAALGPFVKRIETVPATFGRRSFGARVAARVGAIQAGGDRAAVELGDLGARLHRADPFDVLLLTGKRTYPVLRALSDIPLVVDLCDATSSRIRRQIRRTRPVRLLPLALEYVEMRRVERSLLGRARHVLFASVRDREEIAGSDRRGPDGAERAVIPNGVDLDFWRRTGRQLGDTIVLTGAMDYPPNADAAVQLADVILPLVRREIPDARVAIVGRDPSPPVRALADRPGVSVTGFVEDMRPYLEGAAVFAAPIRFGAGIQNKVLEAMAMEVPIVASPLAADGLRAEDGQLPPIDVARGADAFAAAVSRHLVAAAEGVGPDARLRAYAATHFDWGRHAARLEELLIDAARTGAGHRARHG